MSRQPTSPDAPRDTKRDRQQTAPGATGPSKIEGGKSQAAFEVTETPAPSSDRSGKPPLQRKPGPPPGLVAQLMLGFAVLAAAAGTYLVLKLPKAAPAQSEAARPVPAANGSTAEPSRERPPR